MSEKELINYCCEKIEEIFGHGPSAEWAHHHFSLLSDTIEKNTEIIISESTLKRLFGKRPTDPEYIPQLATRDALSKYAGYKDWQDFCHFATNESRNIGLDKKSIYRELVRNYPPKNFTFWFALVLILFFGYLAQYLIRHNKSAKIPNYQISIRNPADTVPFTAIFDYQVPLKEKDTFFLQIPEFGVYPLLTKNKLYTHWFNFSGLFPITLHWKDQIIDTMLIYAQNQYWQPGIAQYEPIRQFKPFYQTEIDPTEAGFLYLSPSTINKYGIDTLSNYWTEFRLFKPFDISLDNLSIAAIARNNSSSGGKPCFDIGLEFIAENGRIQVVFIDKKCFRFVQLKIGENEYDGRYHDLSMFASNVKQWSSYQVALRDKVVSFSIDSSIVFKEKYNIPFGELKGIVVRFFGSGQAKSLEIKNENGRLVYTDHFD